MYVSINVRYKYIYGHRYVKFSKQKKKINYQWQRHVFNETYIQRDSIENNTRIYDDLIPGVKPRVRIRERSPMVTTLSLDPRDPAESRNLQKSWHTRDRLRCRGGSKGKRTSSHTRASERRANLVRERRKRQIRRGTEEGEKERGERKRALTARRAEELEADALSSRGSRGTILTSRPWGARISCRQDLHPHRRGAAEERSGRPTFRAGWSTSGIVVTIPKPANVRLGVEHQSLPRHPLHQTGSGLTATVGSQTAAFRLVSISHKTRNLLIINRSANVWYNSIIILII